MWLARYGRPHPTSPAQSLSGFLPTKGPWVRFSGRIMEGWMVYVEVPVCVCVCARVSVCPGGTQAGESKHHHHQAHPLPFFAVASRNLRLLLCHLTMPIPPPLTPDCMIFWLSYILNL